jgi:kinesin family protein C1
MGCVLPLRARVHVRVVTRQSGVLNLIDLAGSERLKKSEATDARRKETQAINQSLSFLGDVFVALGKKSKHIPYRNSTLTYLLQKALGGDGKTLMMLNLSPAPSSYEESKCSLEFASRVNAVEMGHKGRGVYLQAIIPSFVSATTVASLTH